MRFCIVGTGRCGTSVIRNILNSRHDVFVFNETLWIPHLVRFSRDGRISVGEALGVIRRTRQVTGRPVTDLGPVADRLALRERDVVSVRQMADIVGAAFAGLDGRADWADRTSDYGPYMSLLQAIWPDCRFIHMVRHGMDIAQSMARHPAFRVMAASNATNWVPLSYDYWPKPCLRECMPHDFVRLWRFRLEALLAEEQRLAPGSLARMKFEDLIADPRGFIEALCGFLSLETDAAWLDRAESQVDRTRFANRKTPIGRFFGPGDRRLLSELGY